MYHKTLGRGKRVHRLKRQQLISRPARNYSGTCRHAGTRTLAIYRVAALGLQHLVVLANIHWGGVSKQRVNRGMERQVLECQLDKWHSTQDVQAWEAGGTNCGLDGWLNNRLAAY